MPDPTISGGEVSDVSLHFANHNPPPFQVWLNNIFPADPPNLDWTELRGVPPTIYREELGADNSRKALLEKTYNLELIRKYYIISRQCSNVNPDTGKVLDSQLKALADNFLMDAYLHWNFTPIQIMELKNGKHEADAFLLTSEKNKKTASNSDVVFCEVNGTDKSEIELLANARKQVLSYANDLSRLQSNLLEMQTTITTLQQDKIETEQQYKILIMQLQSKIDEVDKIKNAAIDQATRDVSAVVAEKTFDLQKQNDKLFAELKESHDALLKSRTELNKEYDQRVNEIERTEKALCAQALAELKVAQEQYKSKTKSALEASMREFSDKEKRLNIHISEKEMEISNIKKALSDLVQKTDIQNKSNQGMSDLLTLARSELQTKNQIIADLKSALSKISINAEEKVQQLLASKVSSMEAQMSVDLQIKNNKIIDLEKRLVDCRECARQRQENIQAQERISQLRKFGAQAQDTISHFQTTIEEKNSLIQQANTQIRKLITEKNNITQETNLQLQRSVSEIAQLQKAVAEKNSLAQEANVQNYKSDKAAIVQLNKSLDEKNNLLQEANTQIRKLVAEKNSLTQETNAQLQRSMSEISQLQKAMAEKNSMEEEANVQLRKVLAEKNTLSQETNSQIHKSDQATIAQLRKSLDEKDEAIRKLSDAMKQLKGYLQYRDTSEQASSSSRRIMGTAELLGMSRRTIE